MEAVEVVKSRDICNLLKWEAARCEGLHVAYHRKRGGSEGSKAFGLSRWKDGIDINWLRSERDWGKIMGTATSGRIISVSTLSLLLLIVLLFSSEQSDDMSPDYNSEEALNGDLKESWVDVQFFEDLTKARIKFRVLEDLMHCLSFRHPAMSVHTTEMLIIFGQQRILSYETVMFIVLLPGENPCALMVSWVASMINYLKWDGNNYSWRENHLTFT